MPGIDQVLRAWLAWLQVHHLGFSLGLSCTARLNISGILWETLSNGRLDEENHGQSSEHDDWPENTWVSLFSGNKYTRKSHIKSTLKLDGCSSFSRTFWCLWVYTQGTGPGQTPTYYTHTLNSMLLKWICMLNIFSLIRCAKTIHATCGFPWT